MIMEREWYDDGFTMEEQDALRKSASNMKLHLTDKFVIESADALISSLKVKIGALEAYVQELEESNSKKDKTITSLEEKQESLNNKINELQQEVTKVYNKYSKDCQLLTDPIIEKLRAENKELKSENKKLVDVRDTLLGKLSTLTK